MPTRSSKWWSSCIHLPPKNREPGPFAHVWPFIVSKFRGHVHVSWPQMHLRYGLTINDPEAQAAFLADAWTGSFATSCGEDTRRLTWAQNVLYTPGQYIHVLYCIYTVCFGWQHHGTVSMLGLQSFQFGFSLRQAWCKNHRMLPAKKMPGGWSSHGQPVDQLHGTLRQRIRKLDVAATGMHSDLRKRENFHELELRATGQIKRAVGDWGSVIALTHEAWMSLERKIFQSAWVVTGYVDGESMVGTDHGPPIPSLNEAQGLLHNAFQEYGMANTPQRCTCFEWQIEVRACLC